MQRDPSPAIARLQPTNPAIFPIAEDRKATRRELDAELMPTPGRRPEFERRRHAAPIEDAERHLCALRPRRAWADDLHHVAGGIFPEEVGPFPRILRADP